MRKTALLLLLLAAGSSLQAQQIRPDRYPDSLEIKRVITRGSWPRVVVVCNTGGDYATIPAAVAAVAAKGPTLRNWYSRWTILLCPGPGHTDPNTFGTQYNLTSALTVPDYTSLEGMWAGHNNFAAVMGPTPTIQVNGTSGAQIKLGGGSSLANLNIRWAATPTAAGTVISHENTGGDSYIAQIDNVSISIVAGSNAFAMDGITEAATGGGLYIYGGGVSITGNALGRVVINNNASSPLLGVAVYGGRYAGAGGCTDLFRNAANSGVLKLYEGVRIDAGCTNDLTRAGTGEVEVYGGVNYGPVSGTITNGRAHVAYATTLPATCSPGEVFADSSAAPRLCTCKAADTWACATSQASSASAPYTCDAAHAGATYVDTTTPSLCFCTGSAWTTTVSGGNCS